MTADVTDEPVAWRCERTIPDGNGKWYYYDGPPPSNPSHLAKNIQPLYTHPAPQPSGPVVAPPAEIYAVLKEFAERYPSDLADHLSSLARQLAALTSGTIATPHHTFQHGEELGICVRCGEPAADKIHHPVMPDDRRKG